MVKGSKVLGKATFAGVSVVGLVSIVLLSPDAGAGQIPKMLPGAPTKVTATWNGTNDHAITVSWSAPPGGATSYTVTENPGGRKLVGAALNQTFSGLINGILYFFTVTATKGSATGPGATATAASYGPEVVQGWGHGNASSHQEAACSVLPTGPKLSAVNALDCWGGNSSGQVGQSSIAQPFYTTPQPVSIPGGGEVLQVSIGAEFACALVATAGYATGNVYCWGDNGSGQLGVDPGVTARPFTATTYRPIVPVRQGALESTVPFSKVVEISSGMYETCALTATGHVWCWGFNGNNQVSCSGAGFQGGAVPLSSCGISNVSQISVGTGSACALLNTGNVQCWGINGDGELGRGVGAPAGAPGVAPSGPSSSDEVIAGESDPMATGSTLTGIAEVSVGLGYACALKPASKPGKQVLCWGNNTWAENGNATLTDTGQIVCRNVGFDTKQCTDEPKLATLPGKYAATQIAAGGFPSCATLTVGKVSEEYCWGNNLYAELGIGEKTGPHTCDHSPCSWNNPEKAVLSSLTGRSLGSVDQVGAGYSGSCAVVGTYPY